MPKLLEGLNAEQKNAVTHGDGPLLIVAGAGTGKTTVITRRIAYLIDQGVKPEEILALAFGEKAAEEMEERVDQLLPTGYVNVNVSTYHSFGEQILREYGLSIGLPDFKVLDEIGQWLLIRNNLNQFDLRYYRPLGNPTRFIKALVSHFSRLKDEYISPEEYLDYAEKLKLDKDSSDEEKGEETKRIAELANAYHVYQKLLLEKSALDFGDLINYSLKLFKERPQVLKKYQEQFKHVLVDEFQDTNLAQYELVKLLATPRNNITVVGDDDQSIFKFRGASISNILHFQRDYKKAKFINLIQNYRSTQNILDAAYKFIQQNNPDRLEVKLKLPKKLKAVSREKGVLESLAATDYIAEADLVAERIVKLMKENKDLTWNDFAVLARSHATLEPVLGKLDAVGIPYMYFANKGLYRKTIILDVVSYLRALVDYHDSTALYRVLKLPVFGISDEAIAETLHLAKRKALSFYEAIVQNRKGFEKLLELLEKHSELARTKSCDEVFVSAVNDLGFAEFVNTDTHTGVMNGKYLENFRRKILDFQNESEDKTLKPFMSTLDMEVEAGEQGALIQDIDAGPEAVKLITVHGAKGLEFTYVFVVGMVDKRFPTIERKEEIEIPQKLVRDILPEGDFHLEEERRLFYVAMTRAKKGLFLTRAEDYGGKRTKRASRFLIELGLAKQEVSKPLGEVQFKRHAKKAHLPIPRSFSFSQVSLFRKCPLEYKYRNILKLPVPGSHALSFGLTIHATFEKYLKAMQSETKAADLFGGAKQGLDALPPFDKLQEYYESSWIGDWYQSKAQIEEYRKLGSRMLKDFFEESKKHPPQPKYLETLFKLKLGDYLFIGKIDRADETAGGLLIIDYKTGGMRKIDRVDQEQLMIYQWAAEEFFKESVADLQYWFLRDKLEKTSFLGKPKDIENLKTKLAETIDQMVETVQSDAFAEVDARISHECKYKYLEA